MWVSSMAPGYLRHMLHAPQFGQEIRRKDFEMNREAYSVNIFVFSKYLFIQASSIDLTNQGVVKEVHRSSF